MKSPFDHVNAIYTDQSIDYFDTLEDADKKTFTQYMVNRIISMTPNYLPVVNELQQYYGQIGSRETYLFYSQLLPRRKVYNKYVKGEKDDKYEFWLIDLLVTEYTISRAEALYYLGILYQTDEGKEELRFICQKYGTDPKKIKKAKL
jgi:hypothetical protein